MDDDIVRSLYVGGVMNLNADPQESTDLFALGRSWYWPSEVAKICQVSRATVYRWIEQGVLIPILTIRPFKIPRKEIEKLLNRQ